MYITMHIYLLKIQTVTSNTVDAQDINKKLVISKKFPSFAENISTNY